MQPLTVQYLIPEKVQLFSGDGVRDLPQTSPHDLISNSKTGRLPPKIQSNCQIHSKANVNEPISNEPHQMKSTIQEIRERFDKDVERFSNLETGQSATMDAPLTLQLISEAAAQVNPRATSLLDIGCGAGNYSLKLLERLPELNVTLIDLSRPMLDRAVTRVGACTSGKITAWQGDIRELSIGESQYDVVCAAAVLHHLRGAEEWHSVFLKIYQALKPGGSFWISDLVEHSDPRIQAFMWDRYGQYLTALKGETYRDQVFAYVTKEDSPRSLDFQLDLLRSVGFQQVEVLHKNGCFAAFGGIKAKP